MSDGSAASYIDRQLTTRELRGLIRTARTTLVPERLAKRIRETEPLILQKDAVEIAGILEGLAAQVREGLREAGVEPDANVSDSEGLTTREREHAANFGALLCWLAAAHHLGNASQRGVELCDEGITWCRMSGHLLQEGITHLCRARYLDVLRPADALASCRLAVDVLERNGETIPMVEGLAELSHQLVNRGRFDEAEGVIEKGLKRLGGASGTPVSRALRSRLLSSTGRVHVGRHRFRDAIARLQEALQWADETANPVGRASALQYLGDLYGRLDHHDLSLKLHQEALQLMTGVGLVEPQAWILVALGTAYLRMREYAGGMEVLKKAEDLPLETSGTLYLTLLAMRAEFLIHASDDIEGAEALLDSVIEQATHAGLPVVALPAHALSALLARRHGNPAKAEDHLRKGLELADSGSAQRRHRLMLDLAGCLIEQNRPDEAADYLQQIEGAMDRHSLPWVKLLRLRSAIDERHGRSDAALALEREAAELHADLLREQVEQSFRNARLVAETELLEREMTILQERCRRLEHELSEMVMRFSDREQVIDSAVDGLRVALKRHSAGENSALAGAVRRAVGELSGAELRPGSLLYYLHNAGTEFYRKLRERWPRMTQQQERICVLIHTGLNSREIASLLGLKSEGLKSHRRRLRLVMGLKGDEKIEEVLRAM